MQNDHRNNNLDCQGTIEHISWQNCQHKIPNHILFSRYLFTTSRMKALILDIFEHTCIAGDLLQNYQCILMQLRISLSFYPQIIRQNKKISTYQCWGPHTSLVQMGISIRKTMSCYRSRGPSYCYIVICKIWLYCQHKILKDKTLSMSCWLSMRIIRQDIFSHNSKQYCRQKIRLSKSIHI